MRRLLSIALLLGAALVAVAAAAALGRGEGTESFAASFEARAIGDPSIMPCPGLGPDGHKIEASYEGTLRTSREEEFALTLKLELLFERSEGVGAVEGDWQLQTFPPDPGLVARGELLAVVEAIPPPDDGLGLHGMLIGAEHPPDPGMPARRLLGNFAASLADGATHLTGAIGNPNIAPNPAVLFPPDC